MILQKDCQDFLPLENHLVDQAHYDRNTCNLMNVILRQMNPLKQELKENLNLIHPL